MYVCMYECVHHTVGVLNFQCHVNTAFAFDTLYHRTVHCDKFRYLANATTYISILLFITYRECSMSDMYTIHTFISCLVIHCYCSPYYGITYMSTFIRSAYHPYMAC